MAEAQLVPMVRTRLRLPCYRSRPSQAHALHQPPCCACTLPARARLSVRARLLPTHLFAGCPRCCRRWHATSPKPMVRVEVAAAFSSGRALSMVPACAGAVHLAAERTTTARSQQHAGVPGRTRATLREPQGIRVQLNSQNVPKGRLSASNAWSVTMICGDERAAKLECDASIFS